jgi:hypothetical protein
MKSIDGVLSASYNPVAVACYVQASGACLVSSSPLTRPLTTGTGVACGQSGIRRAQLSAPIPAPVATKRAISAFVQRAGIPLALAAVHVNATQSNDMQPVRAPCMAAKLLPFTANLFGHPSIAVFPVSPILYVADDETMFDRCHRQSSHGFRQFGMSWSDVIYLISTAEICHNLHGSSAIDKSGNGSRPTPTKFSWTHRPEPSLVRQFRADVREYRSCRKPEPFCVSLERSRARRAS